MQSLLLFTTLLAVLYVSNVNAQPGKPRQSPKMTVTGKIGEATITINYSSPSVKGRKIWESWYPLIKYGVQVQMKLL